MTNCHLKFKCERALEKKYFSKADGFLRADGSGKRSAFLCTLFISEKGSTICIWCTDTRDLVKPDWHLEDKRPI